MNSEHVAHLQRMANEAWRGSPEHAALTAAIASLSAPQPPAEAQPACNMGGATGHAQGSIAQAQGGGEVAGWVLGDAFVGVELLCQVYADAYHHGHHATVEGGYIDVLPVDRDTFWREQVEENYTEALAQQPAAVGVEDDEYWTLDRVLGHPERCGIVKTEEFKEWAMLNPGAASRLIVALFLYLPLDGLRDATANKIAAIAQQPAPAAPVGVPVDVVREYLDARACYEEATRRPNSHAPAPVLKHGDPVVLRLREARVALDNAIALTQQPAAVDGARRVMHELCDCPNGRAEHAEWCAALTAQQGGRSDD